MSKPSVQRTPPSFAALVQSFFTELIWPPENGHHEVCYF